MRSVRLLLGLAIAGIALSILGGGHYYVAKRLVLDPQLDSPARELLLAAIVVCGSLLFLQPLAERLVGPPFSRLVSWPAALWMGVGFLLTVLLGASDLLIWLGGGTAFAADVASPDAGGAAAKRALAVVSLAALASGAGLISALTPPRLERLEIKLARWPKALDGFRIVQISDIHIGPILDRRFARHLTERCNALDADLIALTGDLVDGAVRHLEDEVAPLAQLRARLGVYFVTGNHDHYSGADSWVACVTRLGMRALNEHLVLGQGDARFVLAGVDDHRGGFNDQQREDLDAALASCEPGLPVLLLAHDPSTFKKAQLREVDLQLSGHTHAGQIWPFRYMVRLTTPYVGGRYTRRGSELYVSRGTGFWGPPMRLFAPAEITEITLCAA